MSQTDLELLSRYTSKHAEDAFSELVRRHIDLVYSAALRQVRSPQLAEEVAQSAFTDLARGAHRLTPDTILTAWLYQVTHRTAIDVVRREARRQLREQIATEMNAVNSTAPDWIQIEPLLDEAMQALDERDRTAVLLRYFENRTLREVGLRLGTTEDAAQKRVARAVERLREFFSKHGVTVGAGGLVVVISANAVHAAPVGLAITIVTAAAALAETAFHTATAITVTKTVAMTTLQKALLTATVVVLAGAGIYQARQTSRLQNQMQTLRQQQTPLLEQIRELERERNDATNRLALLADELQRRKTDTSELLKLRGEVTRLRESANNSDPTASRMKDWAAQVALLKRKLEQMPNRKIPELQFVTDRDWADATWGADLSTDDGVREALSKLRETAINIFLNEMMKSAFKKYLAAHDNIVPGDLFQLKPYFDQPVTDDMLARYKLLQTGKVDNSADLVTLTAYADDQYDSNHGMSINGAWGGRFNRVQQEVESAANSFSSANQGQMPTDPSQLQPYLDGPLDPVTIQKYLSQVAANPPPPELAQLLQSYASANNGRSPSGPADLLPYVTPAQLATFERQDKDAAALAPALRAYWAANNGQPPHSSSDLVPYMTTPGQKAAYQKLMQAGGPPSH